MGEVDDGSWPDQPDVHPFGEADDLGSRVLPLGRLLDAYGWVTREVGVCADPPTGCGRDVDYGERLYLLPRGPSVCSSCVETAS